MGRVDALASVAFALPVQRLMRGNLLKRDNRQQVLAGRVLQWPGSTEDSLRFKTAEHLPQLIILKPELHCQLGP